MHGSGLSPLRPSLNSQGPHPRISESSDKTKHCVSRQIIYLYPFISSVNQKPGMLVSLKLVLSIETVSTAFSVLFSKSRACKSPSESQTPIGGGRMGKRGTFIQFPHSPFLFFLLSFFPFFLLNVKQPTEVRSSSFSIFFEIRVLQQSFLHLPSSQCL